MKILMHIVLVVLTFSCATQKEVNTPQPEFIEINYGSGGGFTGESKEYQIKPNGKVYGKSNDNLEPINQINASKLEAIIEELEAVDFENIQINESGNMTYFIEVQTTTYKNKISWSDQTQNDAIKQLYKTLAKTLKDE